MSREYLIICYQISRNLVIEAATRPAWRQRNVHAVLRWKFRAATKNSCDTVVAEFFVGDF
jgi:hypothetical protein